MLDESSTQLLGSRNIIINGDMRIYQRGVAANTVGQGSAALYSIDRWGCQDSSTSDFIVDQDTDVPTGIGFTKSLKFTVYSTASSPTFSSFYQNIEGYLLQRLAWGTAGAKNVTLSFWVKCSVTGSYSVCLRSYNGSTLRSYPTLFTVNATNTWEYKTITVPGDTVMVPQLDNNLGLTVFFTPGISSGSAYGGTANQWATANYHGASSGSNLMATQGAIMRITGIQLEEGSVATSFEHRPYPLELALCQRYYFTTLNQSYRAAWHGLGTGNYVMHGVSKFPVTMRTAPSVAVYAYHLEASGLDIGDGRNGVAVYNGGLAAYFTHTFGYGVRSSADAIFGINAGENTSNNVHYAAGYVANAEL